MPDLSCLSISQYEEPLRKRWDQGKYWWELRACAYYSEFEKSKIIYPHFNRTPNFAYIAAGSLSNDKTYIMSEASLYLLAALNSRVVGFFLRQVCPAVRGDYLEFRIIYLEQIPIPEVASSERIAIEALVRKLLDAGGQGAEVAGWEAELNALVYEVYGLTRDEIALIEGETAG